MQLHFLITSEQRASGAMFMESLNDAVLSCVYRVGVRRSKRRHMQHGPIYYAVGHWHSTFQR